MSCESYAVNNGHFRATWRKRGRLIPAQAAPVDAGPTTTVLTLPSGRKAHLAVAVLTGTGAAGSWDRNAQQARLTPQSRLSELEQDYRKLREMIFAEAPSFELGENETLVGGSANSY
jgi:hypothetical protein